MRSEPIVTVRCDGKDCYFVLQCSGVESVEDQLRAAGWGVGWNGKDYCSACQVSDPEEEA